MTKPLITATSVAAVVVGTGALFWWSEDSIRSALKTADRPRQVAVSPSRLQALAGFADTHSIGGSEEMAPGVGGPLPSTSRPIGASSPPLPSLSERDLQLRVGQVEEQANLELEKLVELLDLDEHQKDRIFGALVAHSPHFLPGMQILGLSDPESQGVAPLTTLPSAALQAPASTSDSLLDDIASHLTAEQQFELANAELDRQSWWEEIIPQLLPEDNTPALGNSASPGGPNIAPQLPVSEKAAAEEPLLLGE